MHARERVDLLQTVVRHEVRRQRVGDQACHRHAFVDDLRLYRLLHELLATLADPLAADMPVHEELGGHDVQPLAQVLADAHHRLPARGREAVGVLRLVAVVDAAQVLGQLLAPVLALGKRWRGRCGVARCGNLGLSIIPKRAARRLPA